MDGYREILFEKGLHALARMEHKGISQPENLRDLRELWACAKTGNHFLLAARAAGVDPAFAREIVGMPGFLTPHELWHTRRVRRRRVIAHRGCGENELAMVQEGGECGASWSLSRDVAAWFAGRGGRGIVITAAVVVAGWLDTAESEIIAFDVPRSNILNVDCNAVAWAGRAPDWERQMALRLRPMHHLF